MMRRGEIWDVDLPAPPGGAGREQTGTRPVIIVNGEPDPGNPMCMAVLCTSNLNTLRFSHTLRLEPSAANGLTRPTVALVFQLTAVDRDRFVRKRGNLEQLKLDEVDRILRALMVL